MTHSWAHQVLAPVATTDLVPAARSHSIQQCQATCPVSLECQQHSLASAECQQDPQLRARNAGTGGCLCSSAGTDSQSAMSAGATLAPSGKVLAPGDGRVGVWAPR